MALTRIGRNAIDWSLVYAVRRVPVDNHPFGYLLGILADLPEVNVGDAAVTVILASDIEGIWDFAKTDKRFTVFDNMIAIDMKKVDAVRVSDDGKSAALSLTLGERRATMELDVSIARSIVAATSATPR